MKIKIFNSDEEEIKNKKFNIFIGISIGTIKPSNEKLFKKYISWALKNTKEEIVILIADEIAKFNYRVFSKYSETKAQKRAIREGKKYLDFFKTILEKEFKNKKSINFVIWKDIWDERKDKIKQILEEEYRINKKFKEKVLFFVKEYAKNRKKDLDEDKLNYLSQYIIYELATLLDGIEYKNINYKLLLYPTFTNSGMSKFVVDIENNKFLLKLSKKLNLREKTVLVETYID